MAMVVNERTIAKYVSSILNKLHLANRTQAALYALREGLALSPKLNGFVIRINDIFTWSRLTTQMYIKWSIVSAKRPRFMANS